MDENNPYYSIVDEGIIVVQSECNDDEFLPQQRSIDEADDNDILESTQSINSIHVENFIKTSHFNDEGNISNQIIVQKMDDFMDDGQFNELSIIDTNPENLDQFDDDGKNITVISRNINAEVARETVIISDLEGSEITSNYQDNCHISEIGSTEGRDYDSAENIFIKDTEEDFCASKQSSDENSECERHATDPLKSISNDYPLSPKKEASNKKRRKKLDYIDKNDPRVRLHFVKFMKKDGKTIKIWECGICSKEFIHQYTLMRHLPIHTDERNYVCKECGKAFRQYSTLTQHKAIHSEHRPYVCDICLKTYTRVSTLAAHKKIHIKEKPHNCPECGKGFHQRGNLKNHMFIHSNVRPYKCDLCNRGFNQASNLQCHKAKVHNIGNVTPLVKPSNKFKCSVCNETFSRRIGLQNHEEYVHGIRTTISSKTSQIDVASDARLLKKKIIGNSRIIPLLNTNHNREDGKKMGLLIEPIDTKAMHRTLAAGAIPFALLKPAKGSAVVVKVQLCNSSKHMLVPASPSELRAAGKFSVICHNDGKRAVQIKVPVVATIHQRIGDKGVFHIVEPPTEDDNQLSSQLPNYDLNQSTESLPAALISSSTTCSNKTLTQHFVINSDVLKEGIKKPVATNDTEEVYLNVVNVPDENVQYVLPAHDEGSVNELSAQSESTNDLLAAAVNLVAQSPPRDGIDVDESEIQYLRPTENYGEYEVVEPEDATHFTSGYGIIDDKLKPLMNANVTMDQSQISALMDALKNAGYELASTSDDVEASNQIILNSVDDTIIVGNEIIHNGDQNDLGSVPMPEGIEVVIKEETV